MQDRSVKLVYILSNVGKAIAFEWISKALVKKGYELTFILLSEERQSPFTQFLDDEGISFHWIRLRGKRDWPRVFLKVWQILKQIQADLLHTHLLEASLLGLSAAKLAGIKKRIHSRHHSTYHHRYFPRSVKLDKLINWLSTDIVAISPNVKRVLIHKEGVSESKISLIPHGFDLESFKHADPERVNRLKIKYQLRPNMIVIGSIARYFELKGIQYLIPAIKRLKGEYPNIHLMLFNCKGPFEPQIKALLAELNSSDFTEVKFEDDLFSVYSLFDIYVHLPIDPEIEAFGQTYVESMAASKACVFTLSGIAPEFVTHEENALVVPYEDSDAVYLALKRLLSDSTLKSKLESNAASSVQEYRLEAFIQALERLYLPS